MNSWQINNVALAEHAKNMSLQSAMVYWSANKQYILFEHVCI